MKIDFFKYQGTGNDFIMIDDRSIQFDQNNHDLVSNICQRRFGIGADGLILLRNHTEADFEMVYFNADGKQGSMCGNGGRCTVQFAHDLGIFKETTLFMAVDGLHEAFIKDELVSLKMGDVEKVEKFDTYAFADTGSPHYLKFVEDLENYPVITEGKTIRHTFKNDGTNVNFMELKGKELLVRTFERGVEDETWSCGTGVTAAALFAAEKTGEKDIKIKTKGGTLRVNFEEYQGSFKNIFLTGPAKKVFNGSISI
ncbi:MAG: diaminopimelate epimerase [Bacteroidota bacterium]